LTTVGLPSIAIAIPAHNEAEAIGEFIVEIDAALAGRTSELTFVVVDDLSTDGTADAVEAAGRDIDAKVLVVRSEVNRGHGPTVIEAYRHALDTGADLILQVDGDGQFLGSDLRRIMVLLEDGAEAVGGVRRFRYDPWFRMGMTKLVRQYLGVGFGVHSRDANCPLRGYRAELLDELLAWVPDGALVPNLYLSILAARRGVTMVEVDVNHRVRRGSSAVGTMWSGARRRAPIPGRLVKFSGRALVESVSFHRHVNSGRRPAVSAGRR
jgi:glycosyltransferase involved in cell wall biosynthesis